MVGNDKAIEEDNNEEEAQEVEAEVEGDEEKEDFMRERASKQFIN